MSVIPHPNMMVPRPSSVAILAVDEQVKWWRSRGVSAREAAEAVGAPPGGWEEVRRRMEAWMTARERQA